MWPNVRFDLFCGDLVSLVLFICDFVDADFCVLFRALVVELLSCQSFRSIWPRSTRLTFPWWSFLNNQSFRRGQGRAVTIGNVLPSRGLMLGCV